MQKFHKIFKDFELLKIYINFNLIIEKIKLILKFSTRDFVVFSNVLKFSQATYTSYITHTAEVNDHFTPNIIIVVVLDLSIFHRCSLISR